MQKYTQNKYKYNSETLKWNLATVGSHPFLMLGYPTSVHWLPLFVDVLFLSCGTELCFVRVVFWLLCLLIFVIFSHGCAFPFFQFVSILQYRVVRAREVKLLACQFVRHLLS